MTVSTKILHEEVQLDRGNGQKRWIVDNGLAAFSYFSGSSLYLFISLKVSCCRDVCTYLPTSPTCFTIKKEVAGRQVAVKIALYSARSTYNQNIIVNNIEIVSEFTLCIRCNHLLMPYLYLLTFSPASAHFNPSNWLLQFLQSKPLPKLVLNYQKLD